MASRRLRIIAVASGYVVTIGDSRLSIDTDHGRTDNAAQALHANVHAFGSINDACRFVRSYFGSLERGNGE